MLKIRKHFVAKDNKKCRVWYSLGNIDDRECITIYAKNYTESLKQIFENSKNDSDGQSDYFEKDRVRIFKDVMPAIFKECLQYAV